MKKILDVTPASAPAYPVLCGRDVAAGLAQLAKGRRGRVVIIADETTDALFVDGLMGALPDEAPLRLTFAAGETHKSRDTKAALEDRMLEAGIDRGSWVLAVGGGVVLDLAGFVAATFKRGIVHINVATTLLAQVDASVGGKTAVNTPHGKNLVGAFHHPCGVILDTAALAKLPDDELRCGLAELVKHAVLRDVDLFAALEEWQGERDSLIPSDAMIARAVQIKAEVVAEDDEDRGMRNILNYGHTVAHAIEAATRNAMPHGRAVAIGMVVEGELAAARGLFPSEDLARLRKLLGSLGLDTAPPCAFDDAKGALEHDKKTSDGVVRCALPSRIGDIAADDEGDWARPVRLSELERAWKAASEA